jgi:hypothetical protein
MSRINPILLFGGSAPGLSLQLELLPLLVDPELDPSSGREPQDDSPD